MLMLRSHHDDDDDDDPIELFQTRGKWWELIEKDYRSLWKVSCFPGGFRLRKSFVKFGKWWMFHCHVGLPEGIQICSFPSPMFLW